MNSALRHSLVTVVAALSLLGCSQTSAVSTAGLGGSHDTLVHGRFVFITSADKNELRVLDTAPPGINGKIFVRAPNPLETLSIPVVQGANTLSHDYGLASRSDLAPDGGVRPAGSFVAGNFVFASQPGLPAVSIVSAGPQLTRPGGVIGAEPVFREIRRLPTSAPVVATAGWLDDTRRSTLYFATFDGTSAGVFSLALGDGTSSANASVQRVTTFAGESVVALAVVPPMSARTLDGSAFCATTACLVVATRDMQGTQGRTLLIDPVSLKSAVLDFGAPIRALTVAPQATFRLQGDPDDMPSRVALAPGERIFGTLDEERCGGPACGGIVAVDTRLGTNGVFALARDASGLPMRPISLGSSMVTGLALADSPQVLLPGALTADGTAGLATFPLFGVVTGSNGDVLYFNALNLMHLDVDPAGPAATDVSLTAEDGTALDVVAGPVLTRGDGTAAITLGDGAWYSQTIVVANHGAITGARDLPVQPGVTQTVPQGIGARLRVSDTVHVVTPAGVCIQPVTAVQGDSVTLAAPCSGGRSFSVYSGDTDPLVVSGSLVGYLGRTAPGGSIDTVLPLVFRPQDTGDTQSRFTLTLGPAQVPSGAYWAINVDGHFAPYVVKVDNVNINCSSSTLLYPVRVQWSADRQRFYMLYPSGNAMIELNPSLSVPRVELRLETGMICYR